jgi:Proteins containing SET domain
VYLADMQHIPGLYITGSDIAGRGVHTALEISPGDLIEICPIIKVPQGQLKSIDQTIIYDYYFLWEQEGYEACIALGYGSLYNHDPKPSATVIMDYTDDTIKIEAIERINAGDEITIDYTGGIKSEGNLWFSPR